MSRTTLCLNISPLLEQLYTLEIWEIKLDKQNAVTHFQKKLNLSQITGLAHEEVANLIAIAKLAEDLSHGSLTAHFCKGEGKKKTTLEGNWADKLLRAGMEKYIYRKLDQCLTLAKNAQLPLFFDAAKKSVPAHFQCQWAQETITPHMTLQRFEHGLEYQLALQVCNEPIPIPECTVICFGMPAWLMYRQTCFQLQGVSGKLTIPFKTKPIVEVARQFEATWFRNFLKKNLDGSADIRCVGYDLVEEKTLQHAHIQIVKHSFNQEYFYNVEFQYAGARFYYGQKQQIESSISISESEPAHISMRRVQRDAQAEEHVIQALQQLGMQREDQNFKLPGGANQLAQLVDWLEAHHEQLQHVKVHYQLQHPEDEKLLMLTEKPIITTDYHVGEKDWFDIHIKVQIGQYSVPFRAFAQHIRNRQTEYRLSDKEVFLIPEVWFTSYAELADLILAEEQTQGTIRVGKLQTNLLQVLEIQQITPQHTPPEIALEWGGASTLKADLRPYQRTGVEWILRHLARGYGACLADDMGLGKTLQTIAIFAHLKQQLAAVTNTQPSVHQIDLFSAPKIQSAAAQILVIVPASLVFNWQLEMQRFAPHLFVYAHIGPKRLTDRRALAAHDVVITTYHTNREDSKLLKAIHWQMVVLDESQYIKNRTSEIAKAVYALQAEHKLALSGTPIENSLADLWSLMHFLNPTLLGSYTSFSKIYQTPIEKTGDALQKQRLSQQIQPFILRRRKQDVAPDLPALSHQVQVVPMSDAQAELYEKIKSAARNALLQVGQPAEFMFHALQALTKLRQVACHPALIGANQDIACGKFDFVLSLWASVIEAEGKVLIFSTFEQHLLLYKTHFEAQSIPFAWISGSTPTAQRAKEVERFQTDPSVSTFFITLKSGGTGLNLTAADYVFILDPWWNPQAEAQAIARAHRIGQEKQVHAIRIISKNTIEEQILSLQLEKQMMSDSILDNEMPPLTREQVLELVSE